MHTIKRQHQNKRSVQVGRGSKRGKTSGRGGKGQTARAGHKVRPEIRDIIKRIPKLRGRGKNIFQSIQPRFIPVGVGLLEAKFSSGDTVSPATLLNKSLVRSSQVRKPLVKILGDGELTKKLTIMNCRVSKSARAKIEAAGGTISGPHNSGPHKVSAVSV